MLTQRPSYPARYYARFSATAATPTTGEITGWFDTWSLSDVSFLPAAADMIPVTAAQWADEKTFRLPTGRMVENGAIVDIPAET